MVVTATVIPRCANRMAIGGGGFYFARPALLIMLMQGRSSRGTRRADGGSRADSSAPAVGLVRMCGQRCARSLWQLGCTRGASGAGGDVRREGQCTQALTGLGYDPAPRRPRGRAVCACESLCVWDCARDTA